MYYLMVNKKFVIILDNKYTCKWQKVTACPLNSWIEAKEIGDVCTQATQKISISRIIFHRYNITERV